ncbi:MAG TPA: hypothetical protein VHQ65_16080 [Thermoanaerobaculia bacterium]|nr:hypothetical protein [Thermoanaerobaculia bacterium]
MIVLRLPPGPAAPPAVYRLAGELLAADRPLAELEPWRVEAPDAHAIAEEAVSGDQWCGDDRSAAGWLGEGWVGGVLRQVACREVAGGYLVAVEGAGRFVVAADGGAVTWAGREPPPGAAAGDAAAPEPSRRDGGAPASGSPVSAVAAAVLGPVLALALALRGTFCLHASACLLAGSSAPSGPGGDGAVHVFLGESGAGKSTLARELPRLPGGTWRRLADDVLPVRLAAAGLVALPRFPQLKLATGEQFARLARAENRPSLPVTALHVLAGRWDPAAGPSAAAATTPGVVPVEGRAAALAVAAHTVAARLFPPVLLERHLAFCSAVADGVPVDHLAVPPLPEHAAAVAATLAQI